MNWGIRKLLLLLLVTTFTISAYTQNNYFQQHVDYDISAVFDDKERSLKARQKLKYTNNSNTNLDTIYFHLWANAFSDKNSAFAKQRLKLMQTDFYFASEEEMGGYESITFRIADKPISHHQYNSNPDIVYILLPATLQKGQTVHIDIDFLLKIPKLFSRFGHRNGDYHITHWYPKPAVFDREGWHQMPYLSMGEFYSEYGSYKVEITIPKDYNIEAGGIKKGVVDGVNGTKKHRFFSDYVHDFAFFLSQDMDHIHKEIRNRDGNKVQLNILCDQNNLLWKTEAMTFLEKAFHFFEKQIGAYPYASLSLVQEKTNGSGMEYPLIMTVGAKTEADLEYYIVHEVGHQWFYGILGFNERKYPWLDEGFTTFYEHKYTKQNHNGKSHYDRKFNILTSDGHDTPIIESVIHHQVRQHFHQPINTPVENTSIINYGLNSYEKPAALFRHLEKEMKESTFKIAVEAFYREWQFMHPHPSDVIAHFRRYSKRDPDWLFKDYIESNGYIDYSIRKVYFQKDLYILSVENKGTIEAPFSVDAIKDGIVIDSRWIEGFSGTKDVKFRDGNYDTFTIDADVITLDVNRQNNHYKLSKSFPKFETLTFVPFLKIDDSQKSEIYATPLATYNDNSRISIGAAFYNSTFPQKSIQFMFTPLYNFKSGSFLGQSWLSYDQYPIAEGLRKVKYRIGLKSFHSEYNEQHDYFLRYLKIDPSITFYLNDHPAGKISNQFTLRSVQLLEEQPLFSIEGEFLDTERKASTIHQLKYERFNFDVLNPGELSVILEQQSYDGFSEEKQHYLKLTASYKTAYKYNEKKSVNARIFGSFFIDNTARTSLSYNNDFARGSIALIHQGFNDYLYDEYFFSRNNQDGKLKNQISFAGGGFKNALGSENAIGQSNNYAFSINLTADFPIKLPSFLPLKAYVDAGYYSISEVVSLDPVEYQFKGKSLYSGGIMLDYADGLFAVYIPLFNSSDLSDLYKSQDIGFLNRISFTMNLTKYDPWKLIGDLQF